MSTVKGVSQGTDQPLGAITGQHCVSIQGDHITDGGQLREIAQLHIVGGLGRPAQQCIEFV